MPPHLGNAINQNMLMSECSFTAFLFVYNSFNLLFYFSASHFRHQTSKIAPATLLDRIFCRSTPSILCWNTTKWSCPPKVSHTAYHLNWIWTVHRKKSVLLIKFRPLLGAECEREWIEGRVCSRHNTKICVEAKEQYRMLMNNCHSWI